VAGAGLLASHLAFNGRHQPDVNHFGNFLWLQPLVQLDSPLGGVENHITLRTVADVCLQVSAQFRVHRHFRVIGKLLQELFTGKQRRSFPSPEKEGAILSHNRGRTHNKRLLAASTDIPRASSVSLSLSLSMSRNTKTVRQRKIHNRLRAHGQRDAAAHGGLEALRGSLRFIIPDGKIRNGIAALNSNFVISRINRDDSRAMTPARSVAVMASGQSQLNAVFDRDVEARALDVNSGEFGVSILLWFHTLTAVPRYYKDIPQL
jgi:hypothetical protein